MGVLSPWCHAFISWCAFEAGLNTMEFPKTASTTVGMEWFKNKGKFKSKGSYTPKRGDVIYFKTGASHVGLVENSAGGQVTTIEGNSGAKSCVGRYTYPLTYRTITGYGVAAYTTSDSGVKTVDNISNQQSVQNELEALNNFLSRLKNDANTTSEVIEYNMQKHTDNTGLEVKVVINGDKKSAVLIPVIEDLQIIYERVGTPGKLTFKTLVTDEGHINEGDRVSVRINDKILFVGYVFTKQSNKDDVITITAYNQIRYLKNKDTRVYENMSASMLIKAIAYDFNLESGILDDTKFKISRIEDNVTLLDMILNALDETFMATGEIYTLFDKEGKLSLKNVKDMKVFNGLVQGDTAQNYVYKTSIDADVYNQVKLVYDNEETGSYDAYVTKDSENIGKWGLLQYFEKIDNPAIGSVKSQVLLKAYNRIKKNLTIEGVLGSTEVIAGCLVPVMLSLGDIKINKFMMVEKATHNIRNNEHFMDLIVTGGDFVI